MAGASGTGKIHVIEALAHAVIDAGMRVAWFTLESLTITVGQAKIDPSIRSAPPGPLPVGGG